MRTDLQLLERAMKLGVDISDQARRDGAALIERILADNSQPVRNQIAALRSLVAAERLNADITLKLINKKLPDKLVEISNANSAEVARALAHEMRNDRDYVRFVRDRIAAEQEKQFQKSPDNGHDGSNKD